LYYLSRRAYLKKIQSGKPNPCAFATHTPTGYNSRTSPNKNITLNIRQKETTELEDAVLHLTTLIQEDAWLSTQAKKKTIQETNNIPLHIKEVVYEKRSARRRWQNTISPLDKTHLNRLTHNLRSAIRQIRNDTLKLYTANLTPGDHSLRRATKRFKRPTMAIPPLRKLDSSWARSNMEKSKQFAQHLASFHTTSQEH